MNQKGKKEVDTHFRHTFSEVLMKRDKRGRFAKGLVPHNKGKHLTDYVPSSSIKRIASTQFKKGQLPPNNLPEGTVRRRINKGMPEWVINIDWQGNRKPSNTYKWYLWEVKHQQDRPKGYVLVVKNGDPDDIRLENLELLTRADNLRRNSA